MQQAVRARAREAARALEPEANEEFVVSGYQVSPTSAHGNACPDPDRLLE